MLRILTGHTHHVNSIDYNVKGNLIVSGAADENIRLWDVRQSKCLRILAAHSDPVTAVGFAPDGTIVVSASHDGLIRLWDTATGQCLKTLVSATKSPVMYVRFTPNGRYLLASTMDGCIRLWDYMKDKCAKTYLLRDETSDEDADINRPTNEFKYSSVSDFIIPSESGDKNDNADSEDATGPYIVQGMGKHSIGIWDVQKKQLVDELDDHSGPVLYVNVDTHSGRMVSASMDGTVRIWQPTKRRDSQ